MAIIASIDISLSLIKAAFSRVISLALTKPTFNAKFYQRWENGKSTWVRFAIRLMDAAITAPFRCLGSAVESKPCFNHGQKQNIKRPWILGCRLLINAIKWNSKTMKHARPLSWVAIKEWPPAVLNIMISSLFELRINRTFAWAMWSIGQSKGRASSFIINYIKGWAIAMNDYLSANKMPSPPNIWLWQGHDILPSCALRLACKPIRSKMICQRENA